MVRRSFERTTCRDYKYEQVYSERTAMTTRSLDEFVAMSRRPQTATDIVILGARTSQTSQPWPLRPDVAETTDGHCGPECYSFCPPRIRISVAAPPLPVARFQWGTSLPVISTGILSKTPSLANSR